MTESTGQHVVVGFETLVAGFRRLGILPGGVTMVHSSLSAFGRVDGGAAAVIRALLQTLGPLGTLVMPTLCQKDKELRFKTWDIERSSSDVGHITETLRLWPQALRSDHATHSVAALGPLAGEITGEHKHSYGRPGPWGVAAFGYNSPWEKLYRVNARYCFLGVTMRVNTMGHLIQSIFVERILSVASPAKRAQLLDEVAGWCKPGAWPWYDFERMEKILAERGFVTYVMIGEASCRAVDARAMVEATLEILQADPERWFDAPFMDWYRRATRH